MSRLLQSYFVPQQYPASTSQSTAQIGMSGFGGFGRCLGPSTFISADSIHISQSTFYTTIQDSQVILQTSKAGSGGDGGSGSGGSGCGGGGEDYWDFDGEDEFWPFWDREKIFGFSAKKTAEAAAQAAAKKRAQAAAAMAREILSLGSMWPVGFLMTSGLMLMNPKLDYPSFLFKAVAEVVTRYSSSTFSGLQKMGKEFWSKLFAVDILFGMAASIALDKMLATYARMGPLSSASSGFLGHLQSAFASLPCSIFEGGSPGFNFSLEQQVATYVYKGILFGTVGLCCGLTCQTIINLVMTGNRDAKKSEESLPVSYIVKNAALWGVLLPFSSDSRSQIVKGLVRLVQASPLAKQVPLAALAFAVGMRFASNIYGGLLFVHWAKWSGMMKRES